MRKLLVILLLWSAILVFLIIAPIGVIFMICTNIKSYYTYSFDACIGIDKLGNSISSDLFNFFLIKKDGHKFGNVDETISSVVGKNKESNTLLLPGYLLYKFLDTIQKNHCEASIEVDIVIPN